MMPGLPVSSIPQCKENRHEGVCPESFQAIGHSVPTFIEVHQASKMICNIMSLTSQINTLSLLEDIITSSNDVFKVFVSDMAVEIRKLGSPTRDTAKDNDTVKQTARS